MPMKVTEIERKEFFVVEMQADWTFKQDLPRPSGTGIKGGKFIVAFKLTWMYARLVVAVEARWYFGNFNFNQW